MPRDTMITAIDLKNCLQRGVSKEGGLFIVTNFNKLDIAFHVSTVKGIQRISWTNIEKPPTVANNSQKGVATGIAKIDGKWHATPLLATVVVIEASDIMFAIDSVPAALSVSTNMFIVYTSNILAILGLRQLYFVLEHLQERFAYVRYGVAIILAFTGVKLAILMFHIHIPILASIGFIFSVLVGSIILSIYKTKDTTHA